ncbi:hypothetical protein SSP24_80860 [Streptomyces spinoverrucosus]|uniref:Uncharacterized protein n=1 Tax=Streptomyces spinoverrucosus TaxID=284043 RepID=A0A4Y3VXE7_9ACTN|nr:hypothetical protein SSP24_80860 [Streptomyces spinoverrucosus]GHB48808.1 hypothetical protein GCM10010397_18120 [Streptomyces spinoverrucosus]
MLVFAALAIRSIRAPAIPYRENSARAAVTMRSRVESARHRAHLSPGRAVHSAERGRAEASHPVHRVLLLRRAAANPFRPP